MDYKLLCVTCIYFLGRIAFISSFNNLWINNTQQMVLIIIFFTSVVYGNESEMLHGFVLKLL